MMKKHIEIVFATSLFGHNESSVPMKKIERRFYEIKYFSTSFVSSKLP